MSDIITLQQATTQQDFVNLALMAKAIWEEHYNPLIGVDQTAYMVEKFQSPSAIADQVTNQGYLYYFVQYGDQKIGYIAIQPQENSLFLSKYYIQKEHRGQGAGRVALDFCKQYAREHGLLKIWLTVNRDNGGSIEKYLHMGFTVAKEQDVDIGNGYQMNDYILEITV